MRKNFKAAFMLALLIIVPCGIMYAENFWFEAESAFDQSTFVPFVYMTDENASGDQYIIYNDPNFPPVITDPPPVNGIVSFKFYTTTSIYVWVRVMTPDSNSDSIWMKVNGGNYELWNIGTYTAWTWRRWKTTATSVNGASTLSIARGDLGVKIDKICITNSYFYTPPADGSGSLAVNKINVNDGWLAGNLSLTNDDIEEGGPENHGENEFLLKAFNDDIYDIITFNSKTTAHVQIELPDPYPILSVRAYIDSEQTLKVEAADTVADMENASGTYCLVLDNDISYWYMGWKECQIDSLVKKIWRFRVTDTAAGATTVSLHEIKICTRDTSTPQAIPAPTCTAEDARTVIITWPTPTPVAGTPTPTPAGTPNMEDWVIGYNVYRDSALVGKTTTNFFTDKFLTPNTLYSYTIKACDEAGNESAAMGDSITTGTTMKYKSTQNVLCVVYDPIIKGKPEPYTWEDEYHVFHDYYVNTDTPYSQLGGGIRITPFDTDAWDAFAANIARTTGGSIQPSIVETITVNDYFPYNDPYDINTMSESNIIQHGMTGMNTGYVEYQWAHGGLNYRKVLKDNNIYHKVESGAIDGVVFWTTYDFPAFDEGFMFANEADTLSLNAICRTVTTSRRFWVLESCYHSEEGFGHMVESVFAKAYENQPRDKWTYNVWNSYDINNPSRTTIQKTMGDWLKFNMAESMQYCNENYGPLEFGIGNRYFAAPGHSQVGNFHFPVLAMKEYGWENILDRFSGPYSSDPSCEWTAFGGSWDINNKQYEVSQTADTTAMSASDWDAVPPHYFLFSDGRIDADVKIITGSASADAGIVLGVSQIETGANNFIGYYIGINPYNDRVSINYVNKGNSYEMAYGTAVINTNVLYNLRVEKMDGVIKVYFNYAPNPVCQYNCGMMNDDGVGLRARNTNAQFDNFRIIHTPLTYADNWYNYPDINDNNPRRINSNEWSLTEDLWSGVGDRCHQHWFDHVPRNPGVFTDTDGKDYLRNWWAYWDFNHFNGETLTGFGYTMDDTTFPVPPVFNVQVTSRVYNNITFTWVYPTYGVAGCKLYRDGNYLATLATPTASYTDTTAPSYNTEYNYEIKTHNSTGKQSISYSFRVYAAPANYIYLSDLPWFNDPPVNEFGRVERDMSAGGPGIKDGTQLTLNGITYDKGLGVHAESVVQFALPANCVSFLAEIGIDDAVTDPDSEVVFEVWGDNSLLYNSTIMTPTSPTLNINVPLTGKKLLRLIVKLVNPTTSDYIDWADWADAKITF